MTHLLRRPTAGRPRVSQGYDEPGPGGAPRVPGYRLGREIGRGRRSVAHVAQDLTGGGLVVLKLATVEATAAQPGTSFANEFGLASAMQHDNVIRIFDHGVTEQCAWMAMEHAAGGELTGRIRRGLAPREALALLRQAAEGLWQLHRQGLVHRDVKPANLLLRTKTQLMITDLGLVQRQGEHDTATETGLMVGTPRYAAPEQAQGAPATAAADVYSLGVVFHEMLCGRPPFSGQTLTEVISQNLVAGVPALPSGLAALQPLLDAMLAKAVCDRLPDGRAVLERIEAIGARGIQTLQPRVPERGVLG